VLSFRRAIEDAASDELSVWEKLVGLRSVLLLASHSA
jgi:hypothetical protein